MHVKVFSIQIFQYFHLIPPRVCTLVLFIIIMVDGERKITSAVFKTLHCIETIDITQIIMIIIGPLNINFCFVLFLFVLYLLFY